MQKPFNRKLKLGPGLFMRGGNAPYADNLNTWHRIVNNNVWEESKVDLPGSILPRIASLNGTDNKLTWNPDLLTDATVWTVAVKGNQFTKVGTSFLWGKTGLGNKNLLLNNSSKIAFRADGSTYHKWDGSGNTVNIPSPISVAFSIIWYSDGTNIYVVYDGVYKGYVTPLNTKLSINKFGLGYSDDSIGCDGIYSDLRIWTTNVGPTEALLFHSDSMTSLPDKINMRPQGSGDYEYNISGNENHGTWAGTGPRYTYDINGSLYPLQNGLSMYSNVADDLIRVPYDINGLPLVSPPIPAGYTLRSEHPVSSGNLNMLSCLIDFDPDDTLDSKLDNFDRSNETIFNDDARAGSDYDSNNPYQFHIDNLDPRILFTWRNVDHKGMLYAKIFLDASKNIIFMYEFLNYLTDKKDEKEYAVMIYCGYESIIMVDENGDYKTDDDDYVLIEEL